MTPEEVRDLRHELRTPVNHLIGYSELLLEEEGLAPGVIETLEAIRDRAKRVLGLFPQMVSDDGTVAEGAKMLGQEARSLYETAERLRAAQSALAEADLDRLAAAAARLSELSGRLTTGEMAVDRDTGALHTRQAAGTETILVVDDDEANRDVLARRLQRLGYGVVEARDGVEALETLAGGGIDLVLLDVMMPRLDGYGVLERRRADEALIEVPIIMISALDEMDSIVRGIELGAEDYLPKPFNPTLLKARITASLERRRRRAAELSYLADVAVITEAAARFEGGGAETGALDEVARRPDELGRLAQVLVRVAREAREREQALLEQVRQRGYAFISYASSDREKVEAIVDRLAAAGINVWMDRQDIRAGSHWAAEIVQSIRGCSALLVACSAAAFESRNVRQEIQVAGKYNRPYIPLMLERTSFPDEIEYQLEGWQWIDVLDRPAEDWIPALVEALEKHHVVPVCA